MIAIMSEIAMIIYLNQLKDLMSVCIKFTAFQQLIKFNSFFLRSMSENQITKAIGKKLKVETHRREYLKEYVKN